jgi:hypothetical protein
MECRVELRYWADFLVSAPNRGWEQSMAPATPSAGGGAELAASATV